MSVRIHTVNPMHTAIYPITVRALDRRHGYEHDDEEKDGIVLVLDDGGNCEMFALTGDKHAWTAFAVRILNACQEQAVGA